MKTLTPLLDIILNKIGTHGFKLQSWLHRRFSIPPIYRVDNFLWRLQQRENHRNKLYLNKTNNFHVKKTKYY